MPFQRKDLYSSELICQVQHQFWQLIMSSNILWTSVRYVLERKVQKYAWCNYSQLKECARMGLGKTVNQETLLG